MTHSRSGLGSSSQRDISSHRNGGSGGGFFASIGVMRIFGSSSAPPSSGISEKPALIRGFGAAADGGSGVGSAGAVVDCDGVHGGVLKESSISLSIVFQRERSSQSDTFLAFGQARQGYDAHRFGDAVQHRRGLEGFLSSGRIIVLQDDHIAAGERLHTVVSPFTVGNGGGTVVQRSNAIGVLFAFANKSGGVGAAAPASDMAHAARRRVSRSTRHCHLAGVG
jgi:hypothetical protein